MTVPRDPRHRLGRASEALAADFLRRHGYRILERNYRAACGEVDLVAEDGDCVVFVEVKARRTAACGDPREAVTPRKQRQVVRTAECFLQERGWLHREVRFDVLAVSLDGEAARVEHIPWAFDADCRG
ncbi:YraN family protein [Dissulfurirhabdus thermomarina]|uniref:YraN family protein n=1 Tax=Dissulfurirhabdus thermomarina TaxID=1765737 RepID=UPI002852E50C|nr:YraN family protein [Dissulfurirhabdus thermomarina]